MIRLTGSEFITSAVNPDQYPATGFAEFAFVGRSNVGKSSLLNTILNRRSLAKVSGQPGKTRLVNFFKVKFKAKDEDGYFTLVDLPGYGYAKVNHSERERWKIMIEKYFQSRLQLQAVCVLVDIRHPADSKDIDVVKMLSENNRSYCLVATKSDKIPVSKQSGRLKELSVSFGLTKERIIPFSSLKKKGISEILSWIESFVI